MNAPHLSVLRLAPAQFLIRRDKFLTELVLGVEIPMGWLLWCDSRILTDDDSLLFSIGGPSAASSATSLAGSAARS